jgi:TonB family protein
LSQVLSERALTAGETGDVLEPVLEVLTFLHGDGYVHSRLKPSNILAVGDKLKLSSDDICRFGEAWDSARKPAAYDAPEIVRGKFAAPGDLWSLGMMLVEALTQRLPVFDSKQPPAPIVQDTLPAVFRDIAENCLIRDPERRWTVAEVSARIHGTAPVVVQKPPANTNFMAEAEPEVRREAMPEVRYEPEPEAPREVKTDAPKTWLYVGVLAAVVLVLIAIFVLPKLLHRQSDEPSPSAEASAPAAAPVPQSPIETPPPAAQSSPAPANPQPAAPEKKADIPSATATHSAASQNPSGSVGSGSPDQTASKSAAATAAPGGPGQGAVLRKVLPTVSDRARATIQGTVRVVVKLEVDPSGNVTNAAVDAGSSKYFGDLSLQAARDWKFNPPQPNGQPVSSQWNVSFYYTQTDTTAIPTTTAP